MVDWQSESDLDSIRNSCDVLDVFRLEDLEVDINLLIIIWQYSLLNETGNFGVL